jgi:hypothetical protein
MISHPAKMKRTARLRTHPDNCPFPGELDRSVKSSNNFIVATKRAYRGSSADHKRRKAITQRQGYAQLETQAHHAYSSTACTTSRVFQSEKSIVFPAKYLRSPTSNRSPPA